MIANKDWLRAERVGKNAMHGHYLPVFFAAVGILTAVTTFLLTLTMLLADIMGGIGGPIVGFAFGFALAILQLGFWSLLALLWYERKIFYEIIVEQKKRISELEADSGAK
jgi:hypothetical protein